MASATEKIESAEPALTDYEEDFYLWCYQQAEHLRQRRFGEADLPNIIEELETLGRNDRRALESSYRLVIAHLLKWRFQRQLRSSSWEITIIRERHHIARFERESPTLESQGKQIVWHVYADARREAYVETKLPPTTFPAECPYTLEQLRDPDWLPE